jgi:hypothetical protein
VGYQEGRFVEASFVVLPEDQAPALERLLELSRDEFGYDLEDRHLTDLDGFLRLFAIGTVRDDDTIVGLTFEDRLLLELDDVFRALGPYVQAGSSVLVHGGSGSMWRYDFDGHRCTTRDAGHAPWYGR